MIWLSSEAADVAHIRDGRPVRGCEGVVEEEGTPSAIACLTNSSARRSKTRVL